MSENDRRPASGVSGVMLPTPVAAEPPVAEDTRIRICDLEALLEILRTLSGNTGTAVDVPPVSTVSDGGRPAR